MADQSPTFVQRTYDIQDLYAKAFGQVGVPFPLVGIFPGINPVNTVKAIISGIQSKGKLAPYLQRVVFHKGNIGGQEYFLPNEPTVEVFGTKHVIETGLNRSAVRTGNVLEEINLNNYKVRIRGVIYNEEEEEFPVDDITKVHNLWMEQGSLDIQADLLTILGIKKVAIIQVAWPSLPGFPGAQPYELDCLSDEPFDLNKKKDELVEAR